MANMPHTGFQRLDAGAMTVIIDTGPPPPPSVSHDAHAGCLSFELSSGPSRIVDQLRHADAPAATTGAPLRAAPRRIRR